MIYVKETHRDDTTFLKKCFVSQGVIHVLYILKHVSSVAQLSSNFTMILLK